MGNSIFGPIQSRRWRMEGKIAKKLEERGFRSAHLQLRTLPSHPLGWLPSLKLISILWVQELRTPSTHHVHLVKARGFVLAQFPCG